MHDFLLIFDHTVVTSQLEFHILAVERTHLLLQMCISENQIPHIFLRLSRHLKLLLALFLQLPDLLAQLVHQLFDFDFCN